MHQQILPLSEQTKITRTSITTLSSVADVNCDEFRHGVILSNLSEVEHFLRRTGDLAYPSDINDSFKKIELAFQRGSYYSPATFTIGWPSELYLRMSPGSGVCISRIGGKNGIYVLHITLPGSDQLETLFARELDKQRGLISSNVNLKMSATEGWFNIDLEELLQDMPLAKHDTRQVAKELVEHQHTRTPIIFSHNKKRFKLSLELDSCVYAPRRRAYDQWCLERTLIRRKSSIIGSAYGLELLNAEKFIFAEDRNAERPTAVLLYPTVKLCVRPYPKDKTNLLFPGVYSDEQISRLQEARNYLASSFC